METEYNSYRLGLTKKRADSGSRFSNGSRYVAGTGTARFCSDCARLGETVLGPVICLVLGDTGEGGSDEAKAEDGRAWIGGFLEISRGCQGPWFSLEVEKG